MEREKVIDGATGRSFKLVPEQNWDIIAATFSILYLVVMLAVFSGLLFAILANHSSHEDNPIYVLMAYAAIGGGLGAIVNGIRSFLRWHADRKAFGRRYVWKYISLPLLGAALATMIYAFFRSGFIAFGGNFAPNENFPNQALAAFAIGALSGYGSHRVLKWLDERVKKLFKLTDNGVETETNTGIAETTESDLKDKP
ncbi:MAG: hypothetical protein ACYSUY_15855 [Planctomycetota bacterium]|jgi:hypothetical protein